MKKIILRDEKVGNLLDLGDFVLEFSDDGLLIGIRFDGRKYS